MLGDWHVPFMRKPLVLKVCAAIQDAKPDGICIPGDFLDMLALSSHVAGSLYHLRHITLDKEYAAGNAVLDEIQDAAGKGCEWSFIWGNHEDRYKREMEFGDNAKYGDALQSPTTGLRLRERGFKVHENWRDDAVRLGEHLEVIHGIWCPVQAAKKHLDEFDASVMFGHTHRVQTYVQGKRASFNIGGLFDRDSEGMAYMPRPKRNKWCNGFGVVDVDGKGYYHAQVVQAFNDSFVFDGKLY